jgi:hypothetical protein
MYILIYLYGAHKNLIGILMLNACLFYSNDEHLNIPKDMVSIGIPTQVSLINSTICHCGTSGTIQKEWIPCIPFYLS